MATATRRTTLREKMNLYLIFTWKYRSYQDVLSVSIELAPAAE